jgi:sporulation protein YlmC with PRC-barrel domain
MSGAPSKPGVSAPSMVFPACSMVLLTDMVFFLVRSHCPTCARRLEFHARFHFSRGISLSLQIPIRSDDSIEIFEFQQRRGIPGVSTKHPFLEELMTTSSGHTSAILASKVKGTAVYNDAGDKLGTVEDVVLDKQSNQIMFAALGFGGVFGVGEKYYPVPWSLLDYDESRGGYVVPLDKDSIKNAPAYDLKDLTKHDGSLGSIREQTYTYYNIDRDWQ